MGIRNHLGADFLPSLDDAISFTSSFNETVIIGGGQLYRESIERDLIDRMILSEIDLSPDGDVFFPQFDRDLFCETSRVKVTHDTIPYDIVTYNRDR